MAVRGWMLLPSKINKTLHYDTIQYIALAKNMRAILYLHPDNSYDTDVVDFIAKYHRYRMVGYDITADLNNEMKKHLQKKCFIALDIPYIASIDCVNYRTPWERSLVMGALYLAPVIAHIKAVDTFQKYTIYRINGDRPWNIREFLRHLRISEYAMIDFAIGLNKLSVDIKTVLKEDTEKRYWRILKDAGRHVLGDICLLNLPDDKIIGPVTVLYINYEDLIS